MKNETANFSHFLLLIKLIFIDVTKYRILIFQLIFCKLYKFKLSYPKINNKVYL